MLLGYPRRRHVGDRCIVTSSRQARSLARHLPVKVGVRYPFVEPTLVDPYSGSVQDSYLAKVPARPRSFVVVCHPHSGYATRVVNISIERFHPVTITLRQCDHNTKEKCTQCHNNRKTDVNVFSRQPNSTRLHREHRTNCTKRQVSQNS